jgi:putative ABC transport system substrate-binding protein
MRRREFITLLGSAAVAWPLAARAQQSAKVPRIGFLGFGAASNYAPRVEGLRAGLHDLGYVEGKNIVIEFRWAEKVEQLPELAAELARMPVDIIFASSSILVEPARHATKTIPIVFASHADPIGTGHVASLARPGGNITGLSQLLTDVAVKQLEVFREAVPHAMRIGVLWDPATPSHAPALKEIEAAGEKLGVQLLITPLRTVDEFDRAFSTMIQRKVGGFLVVASLLTYSQRAILAELALKHRLPTVFALKEYVQAGGLMSYGADTVDLHRRAALYIDKILKGAQPADLPVEQASKFELVINLKTAKALGLEIPPTVLARADEVIE